MRRLLAAILAIVLTAAACGGDEAELSTPSTTEPAAATTGDDGDGDGSTTDTPATDGDDDADVGTDTREPGPTPPPAGDDDPGGEGDTDSARTEDGDRETGDGAGGEPGSDGAAGDSDTDGGGSTGESTGSGSDRDGAGDSDSGSGPDGDRDGGSGSSGSSAGSDGDGSSAGSDSDRDGSSSAGSNGDRDSGSGSTGSGSDGDGSSTGTDNDRDGGSGTGSDKDGDRGGSDGDGGRGGSDGSGAGASSAGDKAPAGEVQFVSTLHNFSDCNRLLDHIRGEAIKRVGPYGLPGDGPFGIAVDGFVRGEADVAIAMDAGAAVTAEAAPAAAPQAGGTEGVDFSGTNIQVRGVDEPDIIKTDGRRIITVHQGVLTVFDVTGAEPRVVGRVLLAETWNGEILLHRDRALVLSTIHGNVVGLPVGRSRPGINRDIVAIDEVLLDGTPRRGRSLHVEGRYVSSRAIDGTARIVIVTRPNELGFVFPNNPAGEPLAADANRGVVAQSVLADWLPDYRLVSSEGSVLGDGQLLPCDRVYAPTEFSGFGTLAVLTFGLNESLTLGDGVATFADGETIYASTQNLYVATNTWLPVGIFEEDDEARIFNDSEPWWRRFDDTYRTSIHKFSLPADGPADYEASGSIKGHLLNQFSLHEYDDNLFVAVTDGTPWGANEQSESFIFALAQRGNTLEQIGGVGNMGRGERIYSVRYIGDRAYVVTFRQVDPLYVVDLADPTDPEVLGELKIPGYSAYLHPVGDGLLVGVGRDADETGRILGFQVSLFDVSDPARPRQVDTWKLADADSGVEWDHRAFLWWAPENLMVLPVRTWRSDVRSGAAVFEVTASGGLDYQDRIIHDLGAIAFSTDCYHEFDSDAVPDVWGFPLILICKPGQVGFPVGYNCNQFPVSLARESTDRNDLAAAIDLAGLSTRMGTSLAGDDLIQACRPVHPGSHEEQVQRSLVIGENIWTMSPKLLQSNDLDTLKPGAMLPLYG